MKRAPLYRRTPLRARRPRRLDGPGADPAFLALVREQPCAALELDGHDHPVGRHCDANHDTADRGVGQKAPDRRAFPLCRRAHDDWHAHRGVFAGWTRAERRAWAEMQISRMELVATPEDLGQAESFEEIGLGRIEVCDGRRVWVPGPARGERAA